MIQWFLSSGSVAICVDVLDSLSGVCHGFPFFFQTNRYKQSQYDWKIERKKEGPVREIWLGHQDVSVLPGRESHEHAAPFVSNPKTTWVVQLLPCKNPAFPPKKIPKLSPTSHTSLSVKVWNFSKSCWGPFFLRNPSPVLPCFPPSTAIHTEVFPYKKKAPEDSRNISEASESHVQKASRLDKSTKNLD